MIFQIIGVVLGSVGYFGEYGNLFLLGGGICVILYVLGFLSGRLNPVGIVFIVAVCYFVTGSFLLGLLYGALIGTIIDLVPILIALGVANTTKSN